MRRLPVLSLLAAFGLVGVAAAQTPTWKPQLLGLPEPTWTGLSAVGVNDSGVAVGNMYVSGQRRAWVASAARGVQALPLPSGANWSQVNDVNSSGVAVGQILLEGGASRGVLWRPAGGSYEAVVLPALPGGESPFSATGINDVGDVVGKLGILGGSYYWNETEGVVQLTYSTFPKVPADVNNQRQVVADTYRMDLDTLVLEDVGNPTGTSYGYMYTVLGNINDAGECTGYAVTATSGWPYLPVRYSDGSGWKVFSNFPLQAAGAGNISASADVVFHLGIYGTYVWVEGHGSVALQDTVDPAYPGWDLTNSFVPAMSRGSVLACNGVAPGGEAGIVLLTPLSFRNLGGGAAGALGEPVYGGYGSFEPGSPVRLRLSAANPNGTALIALSTTSNPIPLLGGTLHANPILEVFARPTDSMGRFEMTFPWASVPPGTAFYSQVAVFDSTNAPYRLSMSNGIEGVTR